LKEESIPETEVGEEEEEGEEGHLEALWTNSSNKL
jgi:hypothetical protein